MQGHDIEVVGFSAGGVDPLLQLVADLPPDLPASLFVVHHFPPQSVSALPSILGRVANVVERLRAPIRSCLAAEAEFLDLTVDATDRGGRPIQVRVTCTPLTSNPRAECAA